MSRSCVVVYSLFAYFWVIFATSSYEQYKICRDISSGYGENDDPIYQCLALSKVLNFYDNDLKWRECDHRNVLIWQNGVSSTVKRQGKYPLIPTCVSLVDPLSRPSPENRLSARSSSSDRETEKLPSASPENTCEDSDDYGMKVGDKVYFFNPNLSNLYPMDPTEMFYMKGDVSKLYATERLCLSRDNFTLVSCESPDAVLVRKIPV